MQIIRDCIKISPKKLNLIQEALENYLETITKEKELCIDSAENRRMLYEKEIDINHVLFDIEVINDELGNI